MESMATTAQKLAYVGFAAITKIDKQDDGSVIVSGIASDETLDGDKQICDYAWSNKALKKWLEEGGNVRVQHNPSLYPAGVGVEIETSDATKSSNVTAHVVEPTAVRLVLAKALRAFSVGISSPRIVRDASAPGGRIVGGDIVEVSLVDKPSNPSCGIKLMKGGDGEFAVDTWDSVATKSESDSDDTEDDDTSSDIPAGNGDTDSDDDASDTDDDSQDNNSKAKKSKKVKKQHGSDQLGTSPRREGSEKADQDGRKSGHSSDENVQGKGSEHSVAPSDDASDTSPNQRVQVEKLDPTAQTAPVITEVDKTDRTDRGTFSATSNPGVRHNSNHHDSTSPSSVVGADTYAGEAEGTTPQGDVQESAEVAAEARVGSQRTEMPDSIPDASSQETPPSPESAEATKMAKKFRKAEKKLRKQAKLIAKLKKQSVADSTVEEPAVDTPILEKWNELVSKAKERDDKIVELENKLEKISSQPTLGKAIRAPQSVHPLEKSMPSAEAQQRAQDDDLHEKEAFLESVARFGSATEQTAAQDMLRKLRSGVTLNKQTA